ncbi:helix-turn-helix domain-containing protein [Pontibacter sp. JH31]|uniref:Helix-turn-helix domain-containing protein n=1 Tax=Pontibacter aquaedesilientis TaxID=2766980 RepID=A0ABR7XL48_9BACT|nr:helix-turn-helix domain-containing protein [Pontibacter aquaedesilientis]
MTENPFTIIEQRLSRIESILLRFEEHLSLTNKSQSNNDIMTVVEAAALLSLSKHAIYSKTSTREIPHFKKGKRVYFNRQDLIAWVKGQYQRTQTEIVAETSAIMRVSKRRAS